MIDERIKSVWWWATGGDDGVVMVFDLNGQQMPFYQRPENRAKLREAFPERHWHRGVWRSHVVTPEGEVLYWKEAPEEEAGYNPCDHTWRTR